MSRHAVRLIEVLYVAVLMMLLFGALAEPAEEPETAGLGHLGPAQPSEEELAKLLELARQEADLKPHEYPPWKKQISEALEQKISFDFADAPLDEAIRFLNAETGPRFAYSPADFEGREELPPVTLAARDLLVKDALAGIAEQAGLSWGLKDGVIYIAPPRVLEEVERRRLAEVEELFERLRRGEVVVEEKGSDLRRWILSAVPGPDPERATWAPDLRKALEAPVTFEFQDTPLDEALRFLHARTGVSFCVDPRARGERGVLTVSLIWAAPSLGQALDYLIDLVGLTYGFRSEVIWITTRDRMRAYEDEKTAELVAARERRAEDKALPASPDWERRLRPGLQQKVSFEFADTSLDEVVRFLHALAGVSIVLDPHVGGRKDAPVTLALANVRLTSALDLITHLCGLTYALRSEAVWITTPKRLQAYQASRTAELKRLKEAAPVAEPPEWEKRLRTALKEKVSFEFAETALGEVLRFLKALTGVDFVLDPELAERGKEPVTLALRNVTLGSALDLITDQLDLAYVLRDGVVHIVPAKKAE